MTKNEVTAEQIVAHHSAMIDELRRLVEELGEAVRADRPHRDAATALAQYLETEIFPHAAAEEQTLYAVAARRCELLPLVQAMEAEHSRLKDAHARFLAAEDGLEAYAVAEAIRTLFEVHALKENEHLLPHVVRDASLNQEAVLAVMKEHLLPAEEIPSAGRENGKGSEGSAMDAELDVLELPHAQRHQTIFTLVDHLKPGQALVIVNDHDPQPLRYQLNALFPDTFGWEYLEEGPTIWRVAIRRHHEH